MTRSDALRDLLEAMEAGTVDERDFMSWSTQYGLALLTMEEAYRGSKDAAISFVEAVLPGAWWQLRSSGKYGHAAVDIEDDVFEANNLPDPARALLIAALKALIAQEEANAT